MQFLSHPRRGRRSGEWNAGKAVTFIVTLAATRIVTLAAQAAGMSRKSAYALKDRDTAFAAAWDFAMKSGFAARLGDKVEEVEDSPVSLGQGDNPQRGAPSTSSNAHCRLGRRERESKLRDHFFATLAARHRDSPALAARSCAQ